MDEEKELQERVLFSFSSAWRSLDEDGRKSVFDFAEGYKDFLGRGKTERECVREVVGMARTRGFRNIDEVIAEGKEIEPGMKLYANNRDKNVALFVIGRCPFEKGLNIVGSHMDSPRLDLKPYPLYEDGDLALFKTHYYGMVKKYQWVTLPLALHGVIFTKDGRKLDVTIGEDPGDPVFIITDLLPHLWEEQSKKKMSEGITGEQLNVVIGNIPYGEKDLKDGIKLNILKILNEKYGIDEKSFITAELTAVPAGGPRDVGFDRSLVCAYGQDDKVCAYANFQGLFEIEDPEVTAVCLLVDKEETGNLGSTGMESTFFETTVAELIRLRQGRYDELALRRTIGNSRILSADVDVAYDPSFPEAFDSRNSAYAGRGLVLQKYSGILGKEGSNDANGEFVAEVGKIFDQNDVAWQIGEMGSIDKGGGFTIAYVQGNRGSDVVDCGVAVLSMHAPFELTSKIDLYMAYKGYKCFLESYRG